MHELVRHRAGGHRREGGIGAADEADAVHTSLPVQDLAPTCAPQSRAHELAGNRQQGRGSLSNVVRSGKLLPLPMPPLSVEKTVTVSFHSPAALYADVMFSTALSSASTCREKKIFFEIESSIF